VSTTEDLNVAERLGAMNDTFQSAYDGGMPEDGDYQALVERFDFFESGAGELFLKTELRIQLDPKYEGATVETVHNLEHPERIQWAKKHLRTLGLELDDFSTLQARLSEVLDVPVAITIKTSDKVNEKTGEPYRNVYVNERLGGPMRAAPRPDIPVDTSDYAPAPGAQPGNAIDEDIPF
jgi:antitoxin component HigA of HigAB toxin-antitoxin module